MEIGILLLVPPSITDDELRRIHLTEVDVVVENLDCRWPSLKSDIQSITYLLSLMIEDRSLPDQKLWLEMLTDEQIASGELTANSVKDLLNYTDEDLYFIYLNLPRSSTE